MTDTKTYASNYYTKFTSISKNDLDATLLADKIRSDIRFAMRNEKLYDVAETMRKEAAMMLESDQYAQGLSPGQQLALMQLVNAMEAIKKAF